MSANKKAVKNLARLHGYWIYKNLLSQSPSWLVERRDKYVLAKLRTTLLRAYEGSPVYREQFRKAGFNPRTDFRSPEDLGRLPLLTKAYVRKHFNEMVDHRFETGSVISHTSGSTGEPLPMRLNEYFMAFDNACLFRHWSWAGYTFGARMAALRTYVPTQASQPLWRYEKLKNTLFFSAYHLTPANCSEYVDRLLEFRPQYIKAYPSSIAVFSEFAYAYRDKFDFLRGIFTASETLLASERERVERTFGKKLFNWYGMTEPAVIITECEQHEGMHINWEYGYPEFLPADDLEPNVFRLVTTGFHNPVMPFIRYETGDLVRLYDTPKTCPCGRNMPLVHSIVGRKDECIIMADGRRLPSINFYSLFREFPEILKFQIIQYGRTEILTKVALRPQERGSFSLTQKLEDGLRQRVGSEVALEIEYTDKFITNSDGKTLPIVRKLGTRSIEEIEEYKISSQRAWEVESKGQEVFKLDWNEADTIPSPAVADAVRQLLRNPHSIHWYPEGTSKELIAALAQYSGLPVENVLITHGSDLAHELVATCFVRQGDKVLMVTPSYDNFRAAVEQRGAETVKFNYLGSGPFPVAEFAEALRKHTPRLAYIVNPNNPIGYTIGLDTLRELLECCSRLSTILIVDEAYFEFCGITAAKLVTESSHIVVTRSFSKAFGLAGLRLGYLLAGRQITSVLSRANNPKSVTSFAKVGALAALGDLPYIHRYVDEVRQSRAEFERFFKRQGIKYYPSDSNFILFQCDDPKGLVRSLEERDIFVRERTSQFDGVGHVRISVGGKKSTEVAIRALDEFFSGSSESEAPREETFAVESPAKVD
ncbi:MAG TPA: aminotransferase class I/II-fold pyridoxal phosphate-dependent enzyme [Candidatus Sulfotelmatobacter sp.]|nr:aminotransferase class I/II-fold pyridoxal phosphate-dependent enzyme [Candidatus Sulfotelmatobacter sp.]